ncbi:hypothetical protein GIB67_019503 [Kingdonia uniflora]|uniref:Aminotransferase-like plant mobile domain-containing protein n=1 Tax=Kingdonia uniflora TaxID=39325 RepID=A0A7J7N099_9MAGN|nr:hypothetical protein GIB67_019503 [Kingdonia uniflora]
MGNNLELEHVAFLAFWLSRFVFHAYPEDIICKKVFLVVIRLAQGIRIAPALAILASIYRDLRVLINHVFNNTGTLCVWAPFQIMQIWDYERLPTLRPESKSLRPGEPRMARWHKLNSSSDLKILRFHMSSPKKFQMRPYMSFVENLTQPSFCKEQGEWVLGNINTEEELRSFSRCIRPCELAGLDFIEQYLPHRVGMQFGMDQYLPDGQQDVEYILTLESTSKNLDKSFIKKEVDTLTEQKANENILEEEMDLKSLDIALPEKGSDDLFVPPGFLPTDKDKFKLTQMYKHVKHKKSSAFAHSPTAPIVDAVGDFHVMDMAHIAGLVAATVVANSFEYCDVVTTTTHKMRLVYRKYLLIDPSLAHLAIGFGWLVRVYTFNVLPTMDYTYMKGAPNPLDHYEGKMGVYECDISICQGQAMTIILGGSIRVSRFISSGCGRFIATSHTRYLKPLFLPDCDVIKSHSLGLVATSSKLESGALQFGSKVLVMPSGDIAVVHSLERGLSLAL